MTARLFFATYDPGGANVLLPVMAAARARGFAVTVCAEGPAAAIWSAAGERLAASGALALRDAPSAAVTGAGAGGFDREIWERARAAGIPTLAMIDSWTSLPRRFVTDDGRRIQPDALGVLDDDMRRHCAEDLKLAARLYVVGQASLESVRRRGPRKPPRAREAGGKPVLVYFSECLREDGLRDSLGFDQFTVGGAILDGLARAGPARLLVRPHPRETPAPWRAFLSARRLSAGTEAAVTDETPAELFARADGVLGAVTMALVEAALLGIPILSIQPARRSVANRLVEQLTPGPIVAPEAIPAALAVLVMGNAGPAPIPPSLHALTADAAERAIEAIADLVHKPVA